jgi:hypothetical protein
LRDEAENFVKNKYSSIIRQNKELQDLNDRLKQEAFYNTGMGHNDRSDLISQLVDHQNRER